MASGICCAHFDSERQKPRAKAARKVPTKSAFHRHLPVSATVRARPQALFTGISPRPLQEGADESDVSSSPSGTRSRGPRPQVLLTALPPLSLPEGADESGVSSAPFGFT